MSNGWAESADAWIADLGKHGDYGRATVLDVPMTARVRDRGFKSALDVGCGEGRFCRMLQGMGLETVGIDPTERLLEAARQRDPGGDYRLGRAEALDFHDATFDLVVSYLTLIDIPDIRRAIPEMARVLKPGGALLIANMTSFNSAGPPTGWQREPDGTPYFPIDNYLEERGQWVAWRGIKIMNHHRPLETYMSLLLGQGLQLTHFAEPKPQGGDPAKSARFQRVPYFLIMEWVKPRG
jgi:SAM-dependent methyltransferase